MLSEKSTNNIFNDDEIKKLLDGLNYLPKNVNNTEEFYYYFKKYNLCNFQEMATMRLIKDALDLKNQMMKEKLIYFAVHGYFSSVLKIGQFSLYNSLMYFSHLARNDNDRKVLTKMICKVRQAQYAYKNVAIKSKILSYSAIQFKHTKGVCQKLECVRN